MDATVLPEVVDVTTDGYLAGLRDGGWSGSDDRVRTAIAVSGAVKYGWFGPAVLGRAIHDVVDSSVYNQDSSAESAAHRVTGLVTLIADWSKAVPI